MIGIVLLLHLNEEESFYVLEEIIQEKFPPHFYTQVKKIFL